LHKVLIPLVISILTFNFVANTCYMPSAVEYHGPIQASYLYNRIADDSSILYTYDYNQFETYFYPKNVSLKAENTDLDRILTSESCWIITTERGYNELVKQGGESITQEYSFPYKKLTNISLRFLYPDTRESVLDNVFLLKIR